MTENVIPIISDATNGRKRRTNKIYDVKTFSHTHYKPEWDEAVEIYLRARQSKTSSKIPLLLKEKACSVTNGF